jgi:hypothetical protein
MSFSKSVEIKIALDPLDNGNASPQTLPGSISLHDMAGRKASGTIVAQWPIESLRWLQLSHQTEHTCEWRSLRA